MEPGTEAGLGVAAGMVGFGAILVLMMGLMVALALWAIAAKRKRNDAIAATVARFGLTYVARDDSLVTLFTGPPFGTGESPRARDVVSGIIGGTEFQSFAYTYQTSTHDSSGRRSTTTYQFQVTWTPLPGPSPHVRITPDNPVMRALGGLVGQDVDTESAEFNRVWRVRADDPRDAHAVLAPTVIERLLEADAWGRMFVLQGPALITIRNEISSLADLEQVVAMLGDLRSKIPPFVYGGK